MEHLQDKSNEEQTSQLRQAGVSGSAFRIGPEGQKVEYFEVEEAYWRKTEYNCAMMRLDDLGVPREDEGGNEYSIVGRINILWERAARAESGLETINLRHGISA